VVQPREDAFAQGATMRDGLVVSGGDEKVVHLELLVADLDLVAG